MTDSAGREESAGGPPSLRKRLTIGGLVAPFLVLFLVWNLTSDREPGGASHGLRVFANVAWILGFVGYPLLCTVVKRLPAPRLAARTAAQFAGAVGWLAMSWFLLTVGGGNGVWHAALGAPAFAVLVVALNTFPNRRRAALAAAERRTS